MPGTYILDEHGEPVPVDDVLVWGEWMETAERQLAETFLGDVRVSTVFLGLDHSVGRGKPVLWETMIFRGGDGREQWRWRSREEALAGHNRAVAYAKGEIGEDGVSL